MRFQGKGSSGMVLTRQDKEQAQDHLLHDGALAWRVRGDGGGDSFSRATRMPPGPLVPNPLLLPSSPMVHSSPPGADRLALKT